jgi:hypothetical protein
MKKIVFFIILIIILFAVPITVYLVGQQQELRSRAAPATVLALNPSTMNKTKGDVFSFDVQIDTGGNNVAMAELHLTYDATKLEAMSITNGPFAPKIAASGVVGGGTASITVRAESTTKPIKGTGTIAVIRFKAIESTSSPTQIKFDTTTYVSGLGESNPNVLTNTVPATVQISASSDAVPTVIPTTQTTPQTTPQTTLLPTLVPTLSSTPSAESTPSAQASASAILINVQQDASGTSPNTPLIQGTASPGATVTIVIYSDPITIVVTADATGKWQYTPTQTLADGSHNIVATSQNTDGTTTTATFEFTVLTSAGTASESASISAALVEDAMPTSGTFTYTAVLISISVLLLIGGMIIQLSQIRL